MSALPRTIPEYLDQLRAALAGNHPAVIQDALYDAEEYLRSALAEQPGKPEHEVLAEIASSYGAPDEVAEIYRGQEATVQRALRSPAPRKDPERSALARFFGVVADPRAYSALVYMLLSLATGIFYFTWAVTGVSLSFGLSILIVGIPFIIVFMATVYALSLVEGRLVEVMLGERMPRRPPYPAQETGLIARVKQILFDPHSWTTLLYMVLMLPLGIVYFTLAITALSLCFSFIGAPIAWLFVENSAHVFWNAPVPPAIGLPLMFTLGVLGVFLTLHAARGLGYLHGQIARVLLVRASG